MRPKKTCIPLLLYVSLYFFLILTLKILLVVNVVTVEMQQDWQLQVHQEGPALFHKGAAVEGHQVQADHEGSSASEDSQLQGQEGASIQLQDQKVVVCIPANQLKMKRN